MWGRYSLLEKKIYIQNKIRSCLFHKSKTSKIKLYKIRPRKIIKYAHLNFNMLIIVIKFQCHWASQPLGWKGKLPSVLLKSLFVLFKRKRKDTSWKCFLGKREPSKCFWQGARTELSGRAKPLPPQVHTPRCPRPDTLSLGYIAWPDKWTLQV